MTPLEKYLEGIEAREKAATKPPWQNHYLRFVEEWSDGKLYRSVCAHGPLYKESDDLSQVSHDMDFISKSRQDIPKLVGIIKRLTETLEDIMRCHDCAIEAGEALRKANEIAGGE